LQIDNLQWSMVFFHGWLPLPTESLIVMLSGSHCSVEREGGDMAVPKRRVSHARQGKRRSHQRLSPIQIQYCTNCGEPVLPHRVCGNCGFYRDREVVTSEKEK
jgi:large subunit ribosomal protein L32